MNKKVLIIGNLGYVGCVLNKHLNIKNAAVIGTGGASLAACYALMKNNINYDIYGRNIETLEKMKDKFKCNKIYTNLNLNDNIDLLIICIPSTVKINLKDKNLKLVIDMAYGNKNRESTEYKYVDGYEILYLQAAEQYKKWNLPYENSDILYESYKSIIYT